MSQVSVTKEARVRSYHDVLIDIQYVRDSAMSIILKHGVSAFAGPFDIEAVCMAYMKDPAKRDEINRVLGIR